jgi:hypothetical protein
MWLSRRIRGRNRQHWREADAGHEAERIEAKDRIPAAKIEATRSTAVEINFTQTSRSAFTATVTAIVEGVPVKFSGDATFDKLHAGELKLVKFSVANNDLKAAANNAPQKIQDLIAWGNNAGIAHQVFIVMEAPLPAQFDNNVAVELTAGAKGLEAKVGASGSASGTTTVQISRGTCFAYLLAKIDWDAKQEQNQTKIVDLDDDQWTFSWRQRAATVVHTVAALSNGSAVATELHGP